MPISEGLCAPWPTDFTCESIPESTPQATIDKWVGFASDYLWRMTGRRLGPSCPVEVRPCMKRCMDGFMDLLRFPGGVANSTGGWIPYVGMDGQFRNASLCGCKADCHCGPELCEIELSGPVYDVQDVWVDGVQLPSGPVPTWTLYDGRFLTRLNYEADTGDPRCWPTCQDLTRPKTEPDTFAVVYRTGLTVPASGVAAVSALAAHFIRGCNGGCGCGIGTRQNLQRLSRQGVDLEFADPQQIFTDGRTGIEVVDFFIRSANPYGLASPMRVLSPDAPKRARRWTGA